MDTVSILLAKSVATSTATSVATTISNTKAAETKSYVDTALAAFGNGLTFKGSVDYYNNLPANPTVGDTYNVKYSGSSGTTLLNKMYAWGTQSGSSTWIQLGLVASYTDDGQGNITISEG